MMIAALFVDPDGVYSGLPEVDLWGKDRDARRYNGRFPVVAHPECQRWGRFATGGPAAPGSAVLGDDGGMFESALANVRRCGGVLEHPAYSKAWAAYGLASPPHTGGWVRADGWYGWTCHVEQAHYGHFSRKPTWLYSVSNQKPEGLIWGKAPQRLPAYAVARYGHEKARRIGVVAAVGGKDKTRIRNATPLRFRDVLLQIARECHEGYRL